ncbi:MAG: helix-turn-helix transcriptional regulator [Gemmiger formicilis]|nr:helix-turn-helix transcriptional regulator [Gemmiger formicilis]
MIRNHLSRLLGEKHWSQARLSRETGIRPNTIGHICNDYAEGMSYEQMDRICEALNCDLSDLLEYEPNKMRRTGKDLIVEEHGNRKRK